jgi:protein-S-isoprenylcysteine O-methyltransferase Ste14/alkylhydroperoxidase family enzyme
MRKPAAAVVSVAWGVAVGGTFACLLPYLLNEWHFHRPLPYWAVAQAAGGLLICAGLVPVVQSFTEFTKADGTPVPLASPPRLVVSGFYRYVRNPIYVGFLAILTGEVLLFGSPGLLEYTAVAWCIGAAAVRFYEEPTLARKFGAEYRDYRRAVRAWIPRLHPWTPSEPTGPAEHDEAEGRSETASERRSHMARIKGVPSAQAGLYMKIAYHFTRRSIAKLTGRETEQMIEPLQMYAHVPVLFKGYAKLEQATAKLHRLGNRLHALAELKAATLTHCEYCIDMGSAISRQWGLTDAEILALPGYQASPLFSELDKLVLDYAVGMTRTPVDVPGELFDRLRQHLDDGQIVELTHHIALENMRGRFNLALGIGPAGFSNGMVCAVPAVHP